MHLGYPPLSIKCGGLGAERGVDRRGYFGRHASLMIFTGTLYIVPPCVIKLFHWARYVAFCAHWPAVPDGPSFVKSRRRSHFGALRLCAD